MEDIRIGICRIIHQYPVAYTHTYKQTNVGVIIQLELFYVKTLVL
jgi:hypothetical protein